jgi:hypothetical protein
MCVSILGITLYEKFAEGGWITTTITGAVITLCFLVRAHYNHVKKGFQQLDEVLAAVKLPEMPEKMVPLEKTDWTAILPVTSFSGFGLHHLLALQKLFPGHFKNIVFVSVGVIDSGNFKGSEEIARLEERTRDNLQKYVRWCLANGIKADYRMAMATEAIETVEKICRQLNKEFPKSIVFTGRLIFRKEH